MFRDGDGQDLISDFTPGASTDDVLDVEGAFTTSQVGNDTVIEYGLGDSITLLGVNLADLHADDFLF